MAHSSLSHIRRNVHLGSEPSDVFFFTCYLLLPTATPPSGALSPATVHRRFLAVQIVVVVTSA